MQFFTKGLLDPAVYAEESDAFAEAMAYQELGEHEAARKSLTYYAGFIDDTYVSVPGLVERLAWEYLRNVGIDGAKPDTHLRRFLGADRMGTGSNSPATISEVNDQVARLSEQTGMSKVEIDNLIWSFCADGFGEVCTATPYCKSCPIADYCHGC